MALTRLYDRVSGKDGPLSGSLQVIQLHITNGTTSTAANRVVNLPAGATFDITDIVVTAGAVASDPSLTVGTTAGGTQIAAAVNVTTNLGAVTIKNGAVAAGGKIFVRVTNDANDTITDGHVTITGYLSAPPTSVPVR